MASWRETPWFWPLLFLIWVVVSEAATIILGGDLGAMTFVGLHFAVNPLFALVVAFLTLTKFRRESWLQRAMSVVGAGLLLCAGYLGASGSTWPFSVLGLRFR
jgi:hypothetical protein